MPPIVSPVGDFSVADNYAPIFYEVQKIWGAKNLDPKQVAPLNTARLILENQGMRLIPHLDKNGQCLGWRVWWIQDCDTDAAYKGTTFNPAITCTLPAGKKDQIVHQDFVENCFISEGRDLSDQDCANRLFGINRSADRITAAIQAVRKTLAESLVTFMTANAQANTWTGTDGTVVGTQTQYSSAEFGNLSTLYDIQLNALKNDLGDDLKIVNGINFWKTAQAANDNRTDTSDGDKVRLGKFDMVWDLKMDEFLGRQSTFVFNPNMIGFSNTPRYSNDTPRLLHTDADGSQLFGWAVEDPDFKYLRIDENGRTSLSPIVYDLEYKKTCAGRDSRGNIKYDRSFWAHFNGGTYLSPSSCNGGSGIMEFVNV